MRRPLFFLLAVPTFVLLSCNNDDKSDAYGNFEATTITISAKGEGELTMWDILEGEQVESGSLVGVIDTLGLHLEKLKLIANLESLDSKLEVAAPDVAVLVGNRENLIRERNRTQRLYEQRAATQKQLDDLNGEIDVLNTQINATKSKTSLANRAILSERGPLKAQIDIIEKRLRDNNIVNPVTGTVLTTFVDENEFVRPGNPLYQVANLDILTLKAYSSAILLQGVKLNDKVTVLVDDGKSGFRKFEGMVSWIASEAEFTPKTIETKEERVNLVYAIEVKVRNDGTLKIGMPGEVVFKQIDE